MTKKIAAAFVGVAAMLAASGALAADISMPVIPAPVVVVPPPAPTGFDWSRFYVGVTLGSWRESDFGDHDGLFSRLTASAGFNLEVGQRFVVGIEGQAGVNDFVGGGAEFEWAVLGKAGFELGSRALLYATGGLDSGPNQDLGATWGGGLEIGIGNRFSWRGETLVFSEFGGDFIDHILFQGGLNFYFGR